MHPDPHDLSRDADRLERLGKLAIDWIVAYLRRLDSYPVFPNVRPGDLAQSLPLTPPGQSPALLDAASETQTWDGIFADLDRLIIPGLTHWQSPRFFAYFPCNASVPGIIGEILSAGLNVNGMLWAASPAATELETRIVDWMAEAFGLPEAFLSTSDQGGGCIQGTASEATLVALLAARRRALERFSPDVRRDAARRLTLYASAEAHSSVLKAAMVSGFALDPEDREQVRLIDADAVHAMNVGALRASIEEDRSRDLIPCFICATVGTTSSTALDPVEAIAAVAGEHEVWLHVDAAHAGNACVCPEMRWIWRGVEHADSVCVNPHKWLLTNFDCDLFWTRDRRSLIGALSVTPEYLRNAATDAGLVHDYRDWQIPLGRRFRALKLYLVLRHFGLEGLREHIRHHLRLAALFESWVREDARFEVTSPRTVNLVCFRLSGDSHEADERNRTLLDRLNVSGRALLSHTMLPTGPSRERRFILRMAIGGTWTREHHVRETWNAIQTIADEL